MAAIRNIQEGQEEVDLGGAINAFVSLRGVQYWHNTESTYDHSTSQSLCRKWSAGNGNLAMFKSNEDRVKAFEFYVASGKLKNYLRVSGDFSDPPGLVFFLVLVCKLRTYVLTSF